MKSAILILSLVGATACAGPHNLRSRFDTVGGPALGGAKREAAVPNADGVQVYYASSPAGFTLKENELTVEDGFQHEILGPIEIAFGCRDFLSWYGTCSCSAKPTASKEAVLKALQTRAFEEGANAVIYSTTEFPSQEDYTPDHGPEDACRELRAKHNAIDGFSVGRGWAVVTK